MGLNSYTRTLSVMHNRRVQERLGALAGRLEAITRRIATLGLARAADDLRKVSSELRRLTGARTKDLSGDEERGKRPLDASGSVK
jgi:hypothetical protein